MKIKKVDDKPMVIHTKKKAELHTHKARYVEVMILYYSVCSGLTCTFGLWGIAAAVGILCLAVKSVSFIKKNESIWMFVLVLFVTIPFNVRLARCSIYQLVLICQEFGCSADYLLFGKKNTGMSKEQTELITRLYESIQNRP